MLTTDETKRLRERYAGDAANTTLVFKCAAGLSVIILIGIIGATSDFPSPDDARNRAAPSPVKASVAATQQAMEERRERYAKESTRAATPELPLVSSAEARMPQPLPAGDTVAVVPHASD